MKRNIFRFLLSAVLMMCCTVMVNAANIPAEKIDNIWYILDSKTKTATVTWGGDYPNTGTPEYTGSITIPSTATYGNVDYTVTSIGDHSFCFCTKLTSVTIPNSVTSIEIYAFHGCESLTYVTIPNSVTSIERAAFHGCESLTSVTIPNSVRSIGESAFEYCESLASVTIPNSVRSIGESAFNGCKNMTSITIPNSVTSIEASTFKGCQKLKSVTIPNTVTSIGNDAFWDCDSLASVIIPSSVTDIGVTVFHGCENLALVLWDGDVPQDLSQEFPQENTDIFDGCTGLQKIVVCNGYAEAYKDRFSSYSDKVETLSEFKQYALTEITDAYIAITYDLTEQDEKLIQNYMAVISSATTPGVAFTNKKCALGIINLRPMKNTIITEICWNVYEADEFKGILTDKDKAAIRGYVDAINVATDEETIATLRLSALNIVYLREEQVRANAELNDLEAKYRGIDFSLYKDAVANATSADEVKNIINAVKSIIENGTFATIGSIKYLLKDVGGEYRYEENITFTDKEAYQSNCDVTVGGGITYSRTFTNTNWQPLYVPFAISYNEWANESSDNGFDVAAINNFHEYTDADGKTIKTELEVRLVKSGTLKPNHPYLIRAKSADDTNPQMIFLSTKKISKSEEKSYSCSSMESKYTFTGTYKEMKNLMTSKFIFMSGGKLCKAEDDNVALSPQRWYLKIESLGSQVDDESGSANAKAMQFHIKLLDDDATGIDEITVTRTPLHSSSDAIYNLNGMRVNDNYKGIVIQNGKKVYRK